MELGKLTWPALAFVLLYLALAVVLLPLLVLVYASLLPLVQMPSPEVLAKLTLANSTACSPRVGGPNVLRNTLLLVVSVALIVTLFSFMISWLVVRTQMRGRQLWTLRDGAPRHSRARLRLRPGDGGHRSLKWLPWLPFAGTLGIIAIAHVIGRLPCHAPDEWRLAPGTSRARGVGADERRAEPHDHVAHPPAADQALAGLPGAVDGAAEPARGHLWPLLSGPNNRVLSVSVWDLWQAGQQGPAAAGSVVMALVLGLLMFGILRMTGDIVSARAAPLAQAPAAETK